MSRLCEGEELAGEGVRDTGDLAIVPLPHAPADGYRISVVTLDCCSEGIEETLFGVWRLIDDDIRAWGDAAGLLDIERRLRRVRCIARRPRPIIDIDYGEPIWIDLQIERVPIGEGIAWSETRQRHNADRAAPASDALPIEGVNVVTGGKIGHRQIPRWIEHRRINGGVDAPLDGLIGKAAWSLAKMRAKGRLGRETEHRPHCRRDLSRYYRRIDGRAECQG